ncbi:hypothetical protein [Caballeronia sp. BR00000012568055]|uniref:hypothetical protein n=1 Tax=Caballeronia sp. BR00000012568055 TaxID=2918761 RepID=UPI0023F8EF53|nr:hypothetical protein [Caballeronia sp. BR00000012568055]
MIVLRIPDNADRLLDAFFAVQAESTEWDTPDLFIRFDQPFDTSFGYSRALCDSLLEQYRDTFDDDASGATWPINNVPRHDSAAGFLRILNSFAVHHSEQFRYVAAVFQPHPVSVSAAWEGWLETALKSPIPKSIRLVVVDNHTNRRWQKLADQFPDAVKVIEAHTDMFDIMRETAMHSGGGGATGAYRQIMADVMALLERGSAQQVAERAKKAMNIVQREQWLDQEAVLHTMMAGAWIKGADFERAISSYRKARECALKAEGNEVPGAAQLVMQTWFGEGGAWLAAGKMKEAARAYRSGAEQARRVPDPMFVVEGLRMTGFCFAHARQPDAAKEHYVLAIREAEQIPAAQRPMTTLPMALQDLMRLLDARRVEALEAAAQAYEVSKAETFGKAEKQHSYLGAFPSASDVARIEETMAQQLEDSFVACHRKRERLIAGADRQFRNAIDAGRALLHVRWSGLPELKHALDKTEAELAQLLDADALNQAEADEQIGISP